MDIHPIKRMDRLDSVAHASAVFVIGVCQTCTVQVLNPARYITTAKWFGRCHAQGDVIENNILTAVAISGLGAAMLSQSISRIDDDTRATRKMVADFEAVRRMVIP